MNDNDLQSLKMAVRLLENPSIGAKFANIVGTPIEAAIARLPDRATKAISVAPQKAIHGALRISLKTLTVHELNSFSDPPESSDWWHKAATTGAVGKRLV